MEQHKNLIYSYLTLRKAVGWIGILLPFTLIAGDFLVFGGKSVMGSISVYYYSGMRNLFVGSLCAISLFMFFYKGYDKWDKWLTNLVGFFALGVAFFPATKNGPNDTVGVVHLVCAGCFFVLLACISMFLFTKGWRSRKKEKRNRIYVICGIVIVVSISLIFIVMLFFGDEVHGSSFIFWTETAALVAFGISWLTKGGTIYADKKSAPDDKISGAPET